MIPNNDTSKVHSKYSFKAMSNKYKGNELVQADVRVDCYHSTVDLMSTTMCVDLDEQLRYEFVVLTGRCSLSLARKQTSRFGRATEWRGELPHQAECVCWWRESSKVVLSARGRAGRTSGAV